ncbi:MAG: hypothetical protein LBU34_04115, partial [Planctomycetaceae bacterium]|nr:hypothetical protein [Planctomycetaceae bacterium]
HNLVPAGLWGIWGRFSGGCVALHRRIGMTLPCKGNISQPAATRRVKMPPKQLRPERAKY